jgi:hypothetical protein
MMRRLEGQLVEFLALLSRGPESGKADGNAEAVRHEVRALLDQIRSHV